MENLFIKQAEGILEEPDLIAALSNLSALIMESFDQLNWAGFYLVKNGELVLGPFQGKVACTHIPFDRGVCGLTYRTQTPQVFDDVLSMKDHIACDSASRSELCVPVLANGSCVLEIDLDSPICSRFTEEMTNDICAVAARLANAWVNHNWTV